jgi:hypothetical protein
MFEALQSVDLETSIPKRSEELSFANKKPSKTSKSTRKLRTYHFSEDEKKSSKTKLKLMTLTVQVQKYQKIFYELNDAMTNLIKKRILKNFIEI